MMAANPKGEPPAAFRLVAADELGQLKVVEVPAGPKWEDAKVGAVWGAPDRAGHITALCTSGAFAAAGGVAAAAAATSCWVAAGRLDGRVHVYDGTSGRELVAWSAVAPQQKQQQQQQQQKQQQQPPSRVVGLHFASSTSAPGSALVSVTASGDVAVFAPTGDSGSSNDVAKWQERARFKAASSVSATALSGDGKLLAVGGEGCHLSLWDVTTGQRAWQAKGGKPNALGLVDFAHVTAAAFVEPSSLWPGRQQQGGHNHKGGAAAAAGEGGGTAGSRRVLVAGTSGHKLLVYDTEAGRRPQLEVAWREARVTALAAPAGGGGGPARVWAANGAGAVEALDLAAGRPAGALKGGATGSVRALALLQQQDGGAGATLVASAGLDRFVRVHSAATRACLARVYLKQQLTAVAWLPPLHAGLAAGSEQQQHNRGGNDGPASSEDSEQGDGEQTHRQPIKGKRKSGGGGGGGGKGSSGAAVVDKSTPHKKKKHKR